MKRYLIFLWVLILFYGCGATRGVINNDSGTDGDVTLPDGADVFPDYPFDTLPDLGDTPVEIPPPDIEIDQPVDVPLDVLPDDTPYTDSDGDTIRDEDEGNGLVDTDGDTVPDTLDEDSDNDTIPDSEEAGDDNPLSLPLDLDSDGTPDFRDEDSDGDTISDLHEGTDDPDGDGIPNYRDIDSDGDFITDSLEAGDEDPLTPPIDSDADMTADFLDPDSDNDYISDLEESIEDTDGDGILNYLDTDSDDDGLPDAEESGDTDLSTPAMDCGDDHLPNYKDTDSDNDGVADAQEIILGTDICNADSDGDGVTDLIETTYGSDPLNPADNPRSYGDFVFIVAYMEVPDPTVDTLVFSTNIQHADVFFLVDTTGSMSGEIANLRSSLSSTIIPQIDATISDTWYGVGGFDDYPVIPYGDPSWGDRVFYLEQRTTSSTSAAQNAVNRLNTHNGWDLPESQVPALYATATGGGFGGYLAAQTSCGAGEFGYPCFRSGAVPIVILITDASFHNGPGGANGYSGISPTPPTYAQTTAALNANHIKVIGINSGSATSHLTTLCNDTGSVDSGGNALVFTISSNGTGMGSQVVNAVQILSSQVPIEVSTATEDDPSDAVDATIFIDRIEPNTVGGVPDPLDPTKICVGGLATADRDGDTFPDVFTSVLPGTTVCFDIYPLMNTTVPPLTVPQIFEAYIHVVGDGITILDTRSVFFLVPPEIHGSN